LKKHDEEVLDRIIKKIVKVKNFEISTHREYSKSLKLLKSIFFPNQRAMRPPIGDNIVEHLAI
jgi:HKD family nuclease